jgi:flagellar hook assembly protein FlgD
LPLGHGVRRASLVAAFLALCAQLVPATSAILPARAAAEPPKAVFIVGPTNGLTDDNLADAEKMADQAAAEGMDVRRVFFPHATWENVLANIQGANLVVYMGHGYGWPSPYTSKLTETRQDGFGLNSFDGSSKSQHTYYGATPIRENIRLAPNAVVILVHGCYTAGNGEPGMPIPAQDLARERVDNYASGFLAAGAGAVFAFGWNQKLNFPHALAASDSTMDELFMTPGGGSPAGFVGWHDAYQGSLRSPATTLHLDPHPTYGYYRALTGDIAMTASDWRAGAGSEDSAPATSDPPQITSLSAVGGGSDATIGAVAGIPSFHPNGDGLDDQLVIQHTLTRSAYLDVTVTNATGALVRSFSTWSEAGSTTSRWDGRNDARNIVPDGQYTLTYRPRDVSGVTGAPVALTAMVLTAIALALPSRTEIHASDADSLARTTTLNATLNQPARLSWWIVDMRGQVVRTLRSDAPTPASTVSFVWDGKDDAGRWVDDGYYRSVVTGQTGLGTYSQQRQVFVGAFQINASATSATRGSKITFALLSTEPLDHNPQVQISQSGLDPWAVNATHVKGRRYKVSVTLKTGGTAGAVEFVVIGVDVDHGVQSSAFSLPLR